MRDGKLGEMKDLIIAVKESGFNGIRTHNLRITRGAMLHQLSHKAIHVGSWSAEGFILTPVNEVDQSGSVFCSFSHCLADE